MKEATLLEMKHKIESTSRLMEYMLSEINRLHELTAGTLELLKLMPGYKESLEALKAKMEENQPKKEGENAE